MRVAKPEWKPRRLDELGFLGRGKSRHRPRNDARLYGGPYPFIQTADVMAADPYITSYSQTYSEFGFQQSTRPAPELSAEERAEVKTVAKLLLERIKTLLVLNWRQKSIARSQLKLTIEDVLDTGLPRACDKPLYEQKCSALFEHIFESYPERDASVYSTAA